MPCGARNAPYGRKKMNDSRTKVIATLGPASDTPEQVRALAEAGMDCARLNCSHGTHEDLRRRAQMVRDAERSLGTPLAVLCDLQGAKLRLGGALVERDLVVGDHVSFGPSGDVTVDYPHFMDLVAESSELVIGDGLPRLQVESVRDGHVLARTTVPGPLLARKGISVTNARPGAPVLDDKDLADLQVAVELDADFIALSFVRGAEDVQALRRHMVRLGSKAKLIAKIEKPEAHQDLDRILEVADGVMVARGDLGVEAGLARVPGVQADIIARATQAGKLVITATQMLESMIENAIPTRAEVADIATAVLQGTSAVMLSGETAVGQNPVEAVQWMTGIAREAEEGNIRAAELPRHEAADAAVMHAAVSLAAAVGAEVLLVPTTSGNTARACAKYRPRQQIVALCEDVSVARQLAAEWGVIPLHTPLGGSTDELLVQVMQAGRQVTGAAPGTQAVITCGPRIGETGFTNLVLLREL